MDNRKMFRLTLATSDLAAFQEACGASHWYAIDTGERVLTDDGPDAEAVLLVEPNARTQTHAGLALVH